jgi:hypothetical protein
VTSTGSKPLREGQGLAAERDKRSRLADAGDNVLGAPVLTANAVPPKLRVAPQTGTALLRELHAAGLVREVRGEGEFSRIRHVSDGRSARHRRAPESVSTCYASMA